MAPSIHIMIELCYFSLDQWEIRIHLLWGKCFNIPHHCDPHLNQTKFNDLFPLTSDGVFMIGNLSLVHNTNFLRYFCMLVTNSWNLSEKHVASQLLIVITALWKLVLLLLLSKWLQRTFVEKPIYWCLSKCGNVNSISSYYFCLSPPLLVMAFYT